jgi:histidine ammonia-lyase
MGTVAVRQARRLLENARRVVAIELLAAAEAVDLVGIEAFGRGTRAAHAAVRAVVAPLLDDRPLGDDVERLASMLDTVVAA